VSVTLSKTSKSSEENSKITSFGFAALHDFHSKTLLADTDANTLAKNIWIRTQLTRRERERERHTPVESEDVLVPITGDRGESEYDVTTVLGQKHIYSID
jgi:hypothetical protein